EIGEGIGRQSLSVKQQGKCMIEVRNAEGKLIATIHESEAFAELLDNFELQTRLYNRLNPPENIIGSGMIYGVNQSLIDTLVYAAEQLREIRKKFGDTRGNLYPVNIPFPDDQQ